MIHSSKYVIVLWFISGCALYRKVFFGTQWLLILCRGIVGATSMATPSSPRYHPLWNINLGPYSYTRCEGIFAFHVGDIPKTSFIKHPFQTLTGATSYSFDFITARFHCIQNDYSHIYIYIITYTHIYVHFYVYRLKGHQVSLLVLKLFYQL